MSDEAQRQAADPLLSIRKVSLDLLPARTLALIGPSGSGKSTLARCILALERPQFGSLVFEGQDILALSPKALKSVRRKIHLVFQESASAFDPAFTVERILAEPLAIHEAEGTQKQKETRI